VSLSRREPRATEAEVRLYGTGLAAPDVGDFLPEFGLRTVLGVPLLRVVVSVPKV
jgi:hypothetical protein